MDILVVDEENLVVAAASEVPEAGLPLSFLPWASTVLLFDIVMVGNRDGVVVVNAGHKNPTSPVTLLEWRLKRSGFSTTNPTQLAMKTKGKEFLPTML